MVVPPASQAPHQPKVPTLIMVWLHKLKIVRSSAEEAFSENTKSLKFKFFFLHGIPSDVTMNTAFPWYDLIKLAALTKYDGLGNWNPISVQWLPVFPLFLQMLNKIIFKTQLWYHVFCCQTKVGWLLLHDFNAQTYRSTINLLLVMVRTWDRY